MLADPADARKIAAVGLELGFVSAANFSRAFTQQFDYSASNIHNRKSTGDQYPQNLEMQNATDQQTFEGLLRGLGFF